MSELEFKVDLNQVVFALSDALDLVGVDETAHGKRVGYMAFKCAEQQGLEKSQRERLFNIGMLHDCGVSSTKEHGHLVTEVQWDGAQGHSVEGAEILNRFEFFSDYSAAVRYHHTTWEMLELLDDIDLQVKKDANLIFLVDRVDAQSARYYGQDLLDHVTEIRTWVEEHSGSLFAPDLVELFLKSSESDAFWMMLESPHLERFLIDMERNNDSRLLSSDELRKIAQIFAYIVDAKSEFTSQHSYGVANLSRYLAVLAGLSKEQVDKIEIAALLHDIGKLRIPDEVLEKQGPLSDHEKRLMKRHSFETYQVIRRIDGLSDIALWASYHHETLNGQGYPFHRNDDDLDMEARIIAVADIFQALAQDRPYRGPVAPEEILFVLQDMAEDYRLDSNLVKLVEANLAGCHAAALVQERLEYSS